MVGSPRWSYERALAISENVLGPKHPDTHLFLQNYLRLLIASNREDEAQTLLARFQALQPKRGWLGIGLKSQDDPPGILVTQVMNNSPAAQAGLKPDDLIVQFNGQHVYDSQDFIRLVSKLAPETGVAVELLRDGQPQTLSLTIGLRPLVIPEQ